MQGPRSPALGNSQSTQEFWERIHCPPRKTVQFSSFSIVTFKPTTYIFRVYAFHKLPYYSGVSNVLASLGHTGRRRVVLGHILNTLWHGITKKSHNILSKFTILCWAIFIAILGRMWPLGCGLDTPDSSSRWNCLQVLWCLLFSL